MAVESALIVSETRLPWGSANLERHKTLPTFLGLEKAMVSRPMVGFLPVRVLAVDRAAVQVSSKRDLICRLDRSLGWYSQWRKSLGSDFLRALDLAKLVSM